MEWFMDIGLSSKPNTATAKKDNKNVFIKLGDKQAVVNGAKIDLDQEAVLLNGKTMVPARFVSEALGAKVEWNDKEFTVNISTIW
jgi:hypothetical protein